ncbi:MAG: gliding motility-associated C-terminal domain-containing protein [Saprospiraceae bacterium]|nr:gliding motility-associated C-terminal domain-containing protein [Saprospiraceae bacterium]
MVGVNLEIVEPSCNGESTGSLRANVTLDGVRQTNPENNFTFTWNFPVNGNTAFVDSIPSGNYAVTVTDENGCTALASTTLSQPSAINAVPTVTNATCTGSGNGAISLAVTGGIGAYTFQWSDDATINSANRTSINPGPYRVTITDGNGCAQAAGPFTVGAVKTLSIQQLTLSDVTCNGDDNGQISVRGVTVPNASQSLPYTFNWQGPGIINPTNTQTESTLTNLIAGTYILTLIDSDPQGCQVSDTFEIIEPAALDVTLADSQNETCLVGNDGSATLTVTGGTLPYIYSWSDGQSDSIATNLSAGTYVAVVTDNSGCMDSLNVDILAPTPPTIQPIDTDTVSCQNSTDGSLTVTATPVSGTTITGYQWNNGQSGQTINNLSPGAYVVNVTASDGCTNSDTAFVVAPTPLVIDSIVTVSPTCVGFDNGRLTVFASGGTTPYRYIWANTPQNDTLNANVYGQLTAGTYQVTVVDANNCAPATSSATLTDPPSIDITFSGVGGVSCFENTCDGTATATAIYSDGTPGTFIFSWQSGEVENGVANSTAIQLCAGAQVLVATDANNCFGIDTVSIPSPPAITVQVNAEPVTCNGLSDGAITLVPGGGTPPFSIQWVENGATGDMISNLMAGIYNAILTDSNGCTKTQIVELSEPDALELTLDPAGTTTSVTCNGDTDGQITVQYNSGANINPVGPDPFTWSNGAAPATSPVASNLAPGTYGVTITDVKGCTDTLSYTILNPEPIVAIIPQPTDPLCFGESTIIVIDTVYGGTGTTLFDYTYELNNNGLRFTPDQPATVFAGIQIITVEDPGGCAFIDTIEINQPDELQVVFDPAEIEVELGDSTTLEPIISSSLPIDSYSWTPDTYLSATNVEIPVVSPQSDEIYTLTVVDVNGCAGVGTVRVDVDFSRNVYIPNVFSPNGDGPNDDFRIFTCNGVENIKTVHIFDRWGNLMFTTNDLAPICSGVKLWDGRLNNKLVNPGVYVYVIEVEFLDKISLTYRGDVTLIR